MRRRHQAGNMATYQHEISAEMYKTIMRKFMKPDKTPKMTVFSSSVTGDITPPFIYTEHQGMLITGVRGDNLPCFLSPSIFKHDHFWRLKKGPDRSEMLMFHIPGEDWSDKYDEEEESETNELPPAKRQKTNPPEVSGEDVEGDKNNEAGLVGSTDDDDLLSLLPQPSQEQLNEMARYGIDASLAADTSLQAQHSYFQRVKETPKPPPKSDLLRSVVESTLFGPEQPQSYTPPPPPRAAQRPQDLPIPSALSAPPTPPGTKGDQVLLGKKNRSTKRKRGD